MEIICDICDIPKNKDEFEKQTIGDETFNLCSDCRYYLKMLLNKDDPQIAKRGIFWAEMMLQFFTFSPSAEEELKKARVDAYIFYLKEKHKHGS